MVMPSPLAPDLQTRGAEGDVGCGSEPHLLPGSLPDTCPSTTVYYSGGPAAYLLARHLLR
jgi:hypothetical protein